MVITIILLLNRPFCRVNTSRHHVYDDAFIVYLLTLTFNILDCCCYFHLCDWSSSPWLHHTDITCAVSSAPLDICLLPDWEPKGLRWVEMKTDLYVDFTLGVSQDFCPMKGSSVSCCFNGVLKQLTRPSLCEGRRGGRFRAGWTGGPARRERQSGSTW